MEHGSHIYALFPGRALISIKDGAAAIGWAEKTARNMLSAGTFPVKTVLVGRKRMIVVSDLARYYAELVGDDRGEGVDQGFRTSSSLTT